MFSLTKASWDSNLPIYRISQSKLLNEGIKCLLIDVDGTIINKNSNVVPIRVKKWIKESKEIFKLFLISNNHSEKRISKIAEELEISYEFKALKPRKKKTLKVIKSLNEDSQKIVIIGDRILTDIVVGNRCNIKSILVKRLNKNGFPVDFNFTLMLEKFISIFFK